MTAAALRVLRAVADLIDEGPYLPTVREVSWRVGYASPSTTHAVLHALREEGLVSWHPASPRTLLVTDAGRAALEGAA